MLSWITRPGRRSRVLDALASRLFEWVAACSMLGIAVTLAASPATIQRGSFRYMLDAGLTPSLLGPFFALVGVLRIIALYANGEWKPWGPRCRAAGALLGALIWGQMALALAQLTKDTSTISLGIPVYFCIILGELFSCYRAAADVDPDH